MKKVFFYLLAGITILNLVGCLPSGSNRQELTYPAVVSYNTKEGHPSILTVVGEFAAPELALTELRKDECIVARFTLDWDNQPENASINYASNISYLLVEQNPAEKRNDFDETEAIIADPDYLLPIQAVAAQEYHPILEGKFFLYFLHSAPQKQEMDYIAIVKPNEAPDQPVDLYLIGEKKYLSTGSDTDLYNLYAVDMRKIIEEFGIETTIEQSSIKYTILQLKVNLKYCTGVDENQVPQYKDYNTGTNEITLSLFK